MMKRILLGCLTYLISAQLGAAEVDIRALGKLELAFQQPTPVNYYPGKYLPAKVTAPAGQGYRLSAPMSFQQVEYLVGNGNQLEKNEAFAILRGPQVHHFLDNYAANKELFSLLKRRYESNKALFQRKVIDENRWIDINKEFFAAKLEYGHLQHFYQLITNVSRDEEAITLGAPVSGTIKLPVSRSIVQGQAVAEFLPMAAVKLKIALPAKHRDALEFIQTPHCRVSVEHVSSVIKDGFVNAWSDAIPEDCQLQLGQQLRVTPMFRASAYKVARSAVFEWQGQSKVWVKQGETLRAAGVQLIAAVDNNYILSSTVDLDSADILTSSVSAAQGLLLGLGGE